MLSDSEVMSAIKSMIKQEYLEESEIKLKKNVSKYDSIIVTSKKTAYRNTDTGELLLGRIAFGDKCYVVLSNKYVPLLDSANIEFSDSKLSKKSVQIAAELFSPSYNGYEKLAEVINRIFIDLFSFPSFGCCSDYVKCSDERRCVHPDPVYATACQYRKNLESGRIFYGKNRNIE